MIIHSSWDSYRKFGAAQQSHNSAEKVRAFNAPHPASRELRSSQSKKPLQDVPLPVTSEHCCFASSMDVNINST